MATAPAARRRQTGFPGRRLGAGVNRPWRKSPAHFRGFCRATDGARTVRKHAQQGLPAGYDTRAWIWREDDSKIGCKAEK